MYMSGKARLFAGTASAAFAITLMQSPANAQCAVADASVSCTGTSTASAVNAAIASVSGSAVTVRVQPNATVTRDVAAIQPNNPPFDGAVDIGNAGAIGTAVAPVGINYFGAGNGAAANTFTLGNSGTVTGQVLASGVGGAINATNSGTLSGGLSLFGNGDITLTSSGSVHVAGGGAGTTAVNLSSSRTVTATTGTVGVDAVTTNTTTGGIASADITGAVAVPATGGGTPVAQGVNIAGVGGARLTLNAVAGNVVVRSNGTNSSFTPGFGNSSTVDGTTTTTNATSQTAVGGAATATIGADAQIAALTVQGGKGAASATVAGQVGTAAANGTVSVSAQGTDTSTSSRTVNNATSSSGQFASSSTAVGAAASATLASTGRVFGGVTATSNAGDATVAIAGTVGAGSGTDVTTPGNASASSQGTNVASTSSNSNNFTTGDFSSTSATTRSASGRAASATIASSGAVFGSVNAVGDVSATVENGGRIRDNAGAFSSRTIETANQSANSRVTTAGADGASTVVNASSNSSTNSTVGGVATFRNTAGGVVEDNVNVSGVGGASLSNAGAVFGNVGLNSVGNTATNASSFTSTVTTTPATGGGIATRQETVSTSDSSTTATGGAVTGDYSGTVGAVAGSALSGYRTVTQTGQGGSTATIGGTLIADFTSTAGGVNSTSSSRSANVQTVAAAVAPATGAQESTSSFTSRDGTTQLVANNQVILTGALRNNGTGTGDLSMSTSSGNSTLTVNGGIVEGGISVSAGGINTASGSDSASRFTTAATTAGPVPTAVAQSASNSGFNELRGAAGNSAVTLTRAQVGGNVTVSGRGSGAGSTAAALNVGADSIVSGGVAVFTNSLANTRNENSTVDTRTGANAVGRVARFSTVQTAPTQAGGNAVLTIAGRTGTASVSSSYGNASATLTGEVRGSIDVSTGAILSNSASEQTFAGTSATDLTATTQTGATSTGTTTNVGGTASLAIDSNATLRAAGTSAVTGGIGVSGIGGSTATIAAGSRVIGGNGGSIYVGTDAQDGTNSSTSTFTAGMLTGQTFTSTTRQVGGAASLTNAGIVGASTGYFGASVPVTVESIGGATVANSGTIYGSVNAVAGGFDTTSTSTSTGLSDAVTTRTVTSTTTTARGGTASVTNSGVISGSVSVSGATGTVANTGVIRGGLSLGQAVAAYSTQQVTTATSSTLTATAPATRAVQAYTVNQNGLLLGGVQVSGATVVDPTTGAAAGAVLRTSDVNATVNLGNGSITLGNIDAQVSPTDRSRLTNTTLNLQGTGYLGTGTFDTPSDALGSNGAELRFVNTPAYAGFVTVDPALGSVANGVFAPSVGLASGSRITGVTLVEKAGAGSFTIVGSPFLAASNANAQPVYTMDVGTFRVSGGEVQLGVSGTDPATGASVFGIRGNVENTGGTLLLGRRVTDGSTTVVQGTNVRIDGNLTQSAAGTIALSANPALVRAGGTVVGALPAEGILGFGGYGVALTPFVAYDAANPNTLVSTPSNLTVNGNVALSGTVAVATTPGAIYTAGRNMDLITVSGTFAQSNLTLAPGFSSPFVKFVLTPRTVGTSTIVSLDVQRTPYASVATTGNAAAAAGALDQALPNVVSALAAIRNPNTVTDVQGYGRLQDLATVISGLDTQLSAAAASQVFAEMGSGSIYGSLNAISTTAPFGEAVDSVGSTEEGVGLWARPSGSFQRVDGDSTTGASRLRADNYGGAIGFNVTTASGGNFGIGGGYGRIDARDVNLPSTATADTYMVGAYANQSVGALDLSAQAVFGWSNWRTSRTMPLLARTATAEFDSKEFRFDIRAGYNFDLGAVTLAPFAKANIRGLNFDGFDEQGAGGIGLAVAKHNRTVFSPELGLRVAGDVDGVRPFFEAGYVFQGDINGYRDVSFQGDRATSFRLQGVDPDGFAKLATGVATDVYGARFFLRGAYLTGGGNNTGEVVGGVSLRF